LLGEQDQPAQKNKVLQEADGHFKNIHGAKLQPQSE
jgi:hypothetical protein